MHDSRTPFLARTIVRQITLFTCVLSCALAEPLGAQQRQQPAAEASPWKFTGGIRLRAERWNWFDDGSDGQYWYAGALARAGVERDTRPFGFRVELAAPVLLHLPDDAVQPAPAGQLGLGGTYYASNFANENAVQLFPKNAYVRWMHQWLRTTHTVRVGRFEFNDGTEIVPANETVAAIKRDRISQRLLGTFGWSHVGRSFDGAHWSRKRDGRDVTVVVAAPTRGVFQADGWGTLPIGVAYGAWTRPFFASRGELRVFGLGYADFRDDVVLTDSRPLATRQADDGHARVLTAGGHWLQARTGRVGTADVTLWGAVQAGSWGALSHRAWAGVAELGFQPTGMPSVNPWLRAGISYGSGDGDAADDQHGTFFQVLPTPRPYARLPFYDMQNSTDVYGIVALRPIPRFTLRGEIHGLRLSSAQDLWYQGGGAYQMRSFGYQGRPVNGEGNLATLYDVSAEFRITPDFVFTGYVARAREGAAMHAAYPQHGPGTLAYIEVERRF